MSDEPLSPADSDLARIAASADTHDWYLLNLVELADRNLSTSVGLLVDGVFITGILTSAKAVAEEVDTARTWLADQTRKYADPEELGTDDLEGRLNEFSTAASRAFADHEQTISKLDEEATPFLSDEGFDFDKAPAVLSRRIIDAGRRSSSRFETFRSWPQVRSVWHASQLCAWLSLTSPRGGSSN